MKNLIILTVLTFLGFSPIYAQIQAEIYILGGSNPCKSGDIVYFSGDNSIPSGNSNPIINWIWYVDGLLKSQGPNEDYYGQAFTTPINQYKTYTIKLRVEDAAGDWDERYYYLHVNPNKEVFYYVKDHLGSVRSTINGNGAVVSRDDYYPFGEPMQGRSFNTANPSNSIRFTSHQLDEDFDLDITYAGARYLDTEIGVWMSMDPLRGKFPRWSPYNYTMNNPLRFVDPTGMAPDFYQELNGNVHWFSNESRDFITINGLPARKIGTEYTFKGITYTQKDVLSFTDGKTSGGQILVESIAITNLPASGRLEDAGIFDPTLYIGGAIQGLVKGMAAKGVTAPKGWITQASKKGGGTVFKDPSNPHNIIRQMPGNPNSPNVLQQSPYVKFMKEGKFYDVNGKVLPNGNVPESHIPLNQFNINNMPKF